jgi:hypothetical protein
VCGTRVVESVVELTAPYRVVLSDNEGSVLSVLAGTSRPLSGREVASLSGRPSSTVARLLQRLAQHGLVLVQEAGAGAALLYSLNREHLAADPVVALVSLKRILIDRIKAELGAWMTPPLHASLFGSAARGGGGVTSDIDLFLVRPQGVEGEDVQWRLQVDRLPTLVLRWTGNHAGISEVSDGDIERLKQERPPVVSELVSDAITLVGVPVRELLDGVME